MVSYLQSLYTNRFGASIPARKKLYQVLCAEFFQAFVPRHAVVVEVAAGYCEFINAIHAGRKIAVDLNPDVRLFANQNVEVIVGSACAMNEIESDSVDVVYVSNFFEHVSKNEILQILAEIRRILKESGSLLILQPNIRFAYRDYWMFFDHITALDDRSLCEALRISGFAILECRAQFLPFTTQGRLPPSPTLLRWYLRFPMLHRIFGEQAFVRAKRQN